MTTSTEHPLRAEIFAVAAAALLGVIIATGMLTIGLTIYAALQGASIGDWYAQTFPEFRGMPSPVPTPRFVYVLFFAYVIVAAQVALVVRRRIEKSWRKQ